MTPFCDLFPLVRALFALWALSLCLVDTGSAVRAAVRKRIRFAAPALFLFVPAFFLWQVIFDLYLSFGSGKAYSVTLTLCRLPAVVWFAAFSILTVASVFQLVLNIRYDRNYVTPGAIKLFLDRIPCGICCSRENGMVLFSNVCMNRLCEAVTGEPLLNGNHFREAVSAGILPAEGKMWRFSCRDIVSDGERLIEMIASDVTAEYSRTEALEKDKEELSRINRELGEYYLGIDEAVRRQEILSAKVSIHEEMNRLMLSTVAADAGDAEELDRIFALWEQNAFLLSSEAEESEGSDAADGAKKLADALKIRLLWDGSIPASLTGKQRNLFFAAVREAIVNAVKHAKAKMIRVSFEETEESDRCHFTNGGAVVPGEVRFTGGLSYLSALAKEQGASVSAEAGEEFTLSLSFPKKKNQPIG